MLPPCFGVPPNFRRGLCEMDSWRNSEACFDDAYGEVVPAGQHRAMDKGKRQTYDHAFKALRRTS